MYFINSQKDIGTQMDVKRITYAQSKRMILNNHYAHRMPSISWAFGLYDNGLLKGVVTYGKPASNSLCKGVLGEEYSSNVYELNRLIIDEGLPKNSASFLVGSSLKQLKKYNLCIVSFSDLGMNHNGYIYQACNFIFTGTTPSRTDKYVPKGKHSRHYDKGAVEKYRVLRTSKNRYIYFACDRRMKKEWADKLRYPPQPYPKNESLRYKIGDSQERYIKIVETGEIVRESKIFNDKYGQHEKTGEENDTKTK